MSFRLLARYSLGLVSATLMLGPAIAAEVAGAKVGFVDDYSGPAQLSVVATGKHELQIKVDRQSENDSLTLQVELPITGAKTWPVLDVAVFDPQANAVPVRRGGITWHKLLITAPPASNTFVVRAVDPAGGRPQPIAERERRATDFRTGLRATISKWHGGRRAALSIRFDDSHPTHLSKAVPILNEYGFRGTFMVNPGGHPANSRRRSAFEDHRPEWEAVARRGRHEFANHTLNHRGAKDDESMEHEVGEAAKALWKLFPNRSKLAALNLGGGTQWVTAKPLRHYLDKYHLFDASSNSTGMDDVYGNRVGTFRRMLAAHIERGLWLRVHYHSIGEGLSASEANFRAALEIAKERQAQLWIAGMADIHKYATERSHAKLELASKSKDRLVLKLSCLTNAQLYDHPLTIEVAVPESWTKEHVVVRNRDGKELDVRAVSAVGKVVLRFDVRPIDAAYTIASRPRPN